MKTIILSLTLMYNAFCIGQMPDSSSIWYSTKNLKKDTIPSYESYMQKLSILSRTVTPFDSITIYGNEEPVYHRKKDTVLIEAFVTDTFYRPHAPSYSLKLYLVREYRNRYDDLKGGPTSFIPAVRYFQPDYIKGYYLDKDKIPISKSIIIWQEKEIQ